jgi:Chaperone of endosialidase
MRKQTAFIGTLAALLYLGAAMGHAGSNTFLGEHAGNLSMPGNYNTAIGANALQQNSTGSSNTAVGVSTLYHNTTGSSNIAVGEAALFRNATGSLNTAVGISGLLSNTTGDYNIAIGPAALRNNTTGSSNTAVGPSALISNATGCCNTAVGADALQSSTSSSNTALGFGALKSTTGFANTAVGTNAFHYTTTGDNNIALGGAAGINLTNGSNNIYLGHPGKPTESQTIRLGDPATHTRTFLAGDVGIGTENPVAELDVVGTVQASTVAITSDIRFKTNITPLTEVLAKLAQLRGVSFELNDAYKALGRGTERREIGVLAQDVEAVFPELVTTWGAGYKAVDYGKLSGVLIEAIKELEADMEARLATKDAHVAALEARLAEMEGRLVALEGTIAAAGHATERRGGPMQWSAVGLLSGGPLVGGLLLAGLGFGRNRGRASQR